MEAGPARGFPTLGEALGEAIGKASAMLASLAGKALEEAGRLLERLQEENLLSPLEPRAPSGSVYGVDGGLARRRLPLGVLAILHAVATPYTSSPGRESHLAAVVYAPATGPEAEEAIEASLVALETVAATEAPAEALVMVDGPLADPPWHPRPGRVLEAVEEQLSAVVETPGPLAELHQWRARLLASRRTVGVVKRLTGRLVAGPLEAPSWLDDSLLAASLPRLLARQGERRGWILVGPLPLAGGVYTSYPGLHTCLLARLEEPTTFFRVEALGRNECLQAAETAAALTLPGQKYPAPILAAHARAEVRANTLKLVAGLAAATSRDALELLATLLSPS